MSCISDCSKYDGDCERCIRDNIDKCPDSETGEHEFIHAPALGLICVWCGISDKEIKHA